jgi:hypothetical protein
VSECCSSNCHADSGGNARPQPSPSLRITPVGQRGFRAWFLVNRESESWKDEDESDVSNDHPIPRMKKGKGYQMINLWEDGVQKESTKEMAARIKALRDPIESVETRLSKLNVFLFFQSIFQTNIHKK